MATRLPLNQTTPDHLLYEQDYCAWLEQTARLLREGRVTELDLVNLAEEIADMGRSEKRAVESNLEMVLMHLLKYRYQPELRSNSWRLTLFEHRKRLNKALQESPSLRPYFNQIFAESYQTARRMAAIETGLELSTFPDLSPFTPEVTLDPEYLPDQEITDDPATT
jgi:hypothetical protein